MKLILFLIILFSFLNTFAQWGLDVENLKNDTTLKTEFVYFLQFDKISNKIIDSCLYSLRQYKNGFITQEIQYNNKGLFYSKTSYEYKGEDLFNQLFVTSKKITNNDTTIKFSRYCYDRFDKLDCESVSGTTTNKDYKIGSMAYLYHNTYTCDSLISSCDYLEYNGDGIRTDIHYQYQYDSLKRLVKIFFENKLSSTIKYTSTKINRQDSIVIGQRFGVDGSLFSTKKSNYKKNQIIEEEEISIYDEKKADISPVILENRIKAYYKNGKKSRIVNISIYKDIIIEYRTIFEYI